MLRVILIRHAEPVAPGTAGFEENERPLSDRGRRDAVALTESLRTHPIDAVYSSPYPRAVETVSPIAQARGVKVQIIGDLRERLLSAGPLADWREHLRRAWSDLDYRLPDGESGRIAQARVLRVLESIRGRHRDGTVVASSHGNLIALALHAFDVSVDFEFWSAMPLPAAYRLEYDGANWKILDGPGISRR